METVILSGKSSNKAKLLVQVAKELGFESKKLSAEVIEELEDAGLVRAMKEGRTGKYVSKAEVLKALRK